MALKKKNFRSENKSFSNAGVDENGFRGKYIVHMRMSFVKYSHS